MGCRHTLSRVDHHLSECTTCGQHFTDKTHHFPTCHVYRCDNEGAALDLDGNPVCLRHDIRKAA